MRKSLRDKGVLITGGAGFIGSHLTDRLLGEAAPEVVIVDNFFLGSHDNIAHALDRGAILYREDAEFPRSLSYIFERHNIGTVFNCATKALNYSFVNPAAAFDTNVTVTLNLLELLRAGKYDTLCHFSTSEVYGTAEYEPMDEDHPKKPTTTYAAGKAAADLAVESYVRMFGLDAYIVRPFNNYGPRQNHTGPLAGVIPATVMRILNGVSPEVHGDGRQSRDFIHVFDTVEAVVKAHKVIPAGHCVNISAENCIEIGQLIELIAKTMGWNKGVIQKPARGSDVHCHASTCARLRELIDFRLTPFDEGLKNTIDWYVELQTGKGSHE